MDIQRFAAGPQEDGPESRPEADAGETSAGDAPPPLPGGQMDEAENLNRLAKIVLALIPALTVALAAVGGATGGLGRLFRDQTVAAQASIGLIFLSFLLAALARRPARASGEGASIRIPVRATFLVISAVALVIGIAWAFEAQITVMGVGQAPVVRGAVVPTSMGDSLDAQVEATGVKSSARIVVFAFESSDRNGDSKSTKVPLYYSKTGPDPEGRVDVHVLAQVPASDLQQFPYLFVTAVLGEDQRDCDGALVETKGPKRPDETACLTLERPGAPPPPASPPSSAPSAAGLPSPTVVDVPGTQPWTRTSVVLAKGQHFQVHATGRVSFIQGAAPVGPDGDTKPHPNVCVLPGPDHHAALIGLITGPGSEALFLVGSDYDGVATADGQLELGINDVGVDNNGGAFQASIQVAPH